MLRMSFPAALNQQNSTVFGPTLESGRIDVPIAQIANLIVGMIDYCNQEDTQYLFFAEQALFGVTLAAGGRSEALPIDRLYAGASYDTNLQSELPYCDCQALVDRTYFLPLGDRSWPDDTLVKYEYMDERNGTSPR